VNHVRRAPRLHLHANTDDALLALMRGAGFSDAGETEQRSLRFGGLIYYRAGAPRG